MVSLSRQRAADLHQALSGCLSKGRADLSTVRRLILRGQPKLDTRAVRSNPKAIIFIGLESFNLRIAAEQHTPERERSFFF